MPKPFPPEFRRDVIAVARRREGPLSQVAHDSGISPSCPQRWLALTDHEDGITAGSNPPADGPSDAEARELRQRNKLLEQENEILRRATAYFARDVLPQ